MQERHTNRYKYFKELAETSRNFFVPYIQAYHTIGTNVKVLEVGCGEGGNLLPFAEMGCSVTGVDIAAFRIEEAKTFFETKQTKGIFIAADIFNLKELEHGFDIIICHDVFEHIDNKQGLLANLGKYLKPQGIMFVAFPAWQMPFGGHQQICKSKFLSHLPFIHLLPTAIYRLLLNTLGEDNGCIKELLSIKRTKISVESFSNLLEQSSLKAVNRLLWLVNPHYEVKFGLPPSKLPTLLSRIPYLRDFFSTSCWYILCEKTKYI